MEVDYDRPVKRLEILAKSEERITFVPRGHMIVKRWEDGTPNVVVWVELGGGGEISAGAEDRGVQYCVVRRIINYCCNI